MLTFFIPLWIKIIQVCFDCMLSKSLRQNIICYSSTCSNISICWIKRIISLFPFAAKRLKPLLIAPILTWSKTVVSICPLLL